MSKLVKPSNNINALFLAAIIVIGIIGISSFTAYGEVYQSANCDDTNVNINNINQKQIQRQNQNNNFDTIATEAQQLSPEEEVLNALTSNNNGEPLLNVKRNIVNTCINYNDNELVGISIGKQESDNETPNGPPQPTECTDCFLGQDEGGILLPAFVDALRDFFDTEPIFRIFQVRSTGELCNIINNAVTTTTPVTEQEIRTLFDDPLLSNSPDQIQKVIDCLIKLRLITPTP